MDLFGTPPVLLAVFNRPDLAEKVFEAIRKARPAHLFVAADGPRRDRPEERALCEAARRVTEQIDWPCRCERLYQPENLGCGKAMVTAISWFFDNVEEGIVLEDDCIPSLDFFRFCGELLERYRDDPKVALISGSNFQKAGSLKNGSASYYFSEYPHVWGWASWRRFWKTYRFDVAAHDDAEGVLTGKIADPNVREYFFQAFENLRAGGLDIWDYQLVLECFRSDRMTAIPGENLVMNDGFDARATHTRSEDDTLSISTGSMPFPLVHPASLDVNRNADRYTEIKYYRKERFPKENNILLFLHWIKQKAGW